MVKFSIVFCFVFISALFIDFAVATKKSVGYYEIKKGDISVTVTNYGATILSVKVPDNKGNIADIALGFRSIGQYTVRLEFDFGVANRISGARFDINGKTYKVFPNEGNNTFHGGHRGFGDVFWTVKNHQKDGFPGDLSVSVTYKLMKYNKLAVIMKAKPLNKATPVNLAQHTYWNLGGHNSGNILQNKIQMFGSQITPVDEKLLPTGETTSVKNTPYDFLKPQVIGSRIDQLSSGYDINYVLNGPINSIIRKAAKVHDLKSGRILELWTNKPGLQFYTANKLENVKGKDGVVYKAHAGLCLETQGFPDAVNHPNFPSQIVNPGETYRHFMLYKFSTS
ncbi:hypothetical protein MKW98_017802 [Papaver atlanticum]|uniref:Aldose 1-epimerase n=1 Tax=Papaver atlanticum TaxID=357466 RepID=A0AAD4XWC4_9MAGN|nr:hypothetical protein MKW98_017802 [Papaver atlanticum]